MTFHWSEPQGPTAPETYFAEPGDMWLWPLHGAHHGGKLLLFFSRLQATSQGLGFEGVDWQAKLVHNPDAPPSTCRVWPTRWSEASLAR